MIFLSEQLKYKGYKLFHVDVTVYRREGVEKLVAMFVKIGGLD